MQFSTLGPRSRLRLEPNIFRFLGNFWRDAVVADAPVIEYEGGGRQQDFIKAIMPSLVRAASLVVVDMIRYGCGTFYNKIPMVVQSLDPRFWFPIRDGDNLYKSLGEMQAFTWSSNLQNHLDRITITLFRDGVATTQRHLMEGYQIQRPIGPAEQVSVSSSPIIPVIWGEGFYGTSDFEDVEQYVAEMQRRETLVSKALDKHVSPHLAMPESSITVDTSGKAVLDQAGMVIPVAAGEQTPEFITWDASFDAQEKAILRAEEQILRFSAIAPILVEIERQGGREVASGAALRRLAIPTVNKIKCMRESLTEAMKDTIISQAELSGVAGGEVVEIERDKLSVLWPPELAAGMTDEADPIVTLVNAGVLSKVQAIQLVSKVSREEAERVIMEGEASGDSTDDVREDVRPDRRSQASL